MFLFARHDGEMEQLIGAGGFEDFDTVDGRFLMQSEVSYLHNWSTCCVVCIQVYLESWAFIATGRVQFSVCVFCTEY